MNIVNTYLDYCVEQSTQPRVSQFLSRHRNEILTANGGIYDPLRLQQLWMDRLKTASKIYGVRIEFDAEATVWIQLVQDVSDVHASMKSIAVKEFRRQKTLDLWTTANEATGSHLEDELPLDPIKEKDPIRGVEKTKRKLSDFVDEENANYSTSSRASNDDNDSQHSSGLLNSDLTYYPSSDADESTAEYPQQYKYQCHLDYKEFNASLVSLLPNCRAMAATSSTKTKQYHQVHDLAKTGQLSPKALDYCLWYSGIFPSSTVDLARFPVGTRLPPSIQNDVTNLKDAIETRSIFIPTPLSSPTTTESPRTLDHWKLTQVLMNVYLFYHYLPLSPPTPMEADSLTTSSMSEVNLIATSLTGLLTPLFSDKIYIKWDTSSTVYNKENGNPMDQRTTRSDLLFCARMDSGQTVEIGNGEVKPPGRSQCHINSDRTKMLLLAKRQLHAKLLLDRVEENLMTFGMMVRGDTIELYIIYFDDLEPFYTYYTYAILKLPFLNNHYLLLDITLKRLLGWKDLMIKSLIKTSPTPLAHALMFEKFKDRLLPTVSHYQPLTADQFSRLGQI